MKYMIRIFKTSYKKKSFLTGKYFFFFYLQFTQSINSLLLLFCFVLRGRGWYIKMYRVHGKLFFSLQFPYEYDSLDLAAAKSLQSCPTLWDPIDGSPPGSPVPGILQARTMDWVAISFSNAWKWKAKMKSLSGVRLFTAPRTAAYQAPPTMGFSR